MRMKGPEGKFIKDWPEKRKFIKKENGGGQREERGKALPRSDRPNAGLTRIPAATGHWPAFSFTVARASLPEVHPITLSASLLPSLR
jgi:hypothetical protein